MLFTTSTQYAVLALLLVIGWLFGFASNGGGRKWRARYEAERQARADEAAALREQLREAEAQRAAPVTAAARPIVAQDRARPAMTGARRGWFDWEGRR